MIRHVPKAGMPVLVLRTAAVQMVSWELEDGTGVCNPWSKAMKEASVAVAVWEVRQVAAGEALAA